MIAAFFPLKKLRRNTRYLLFLAILLAGLAAVYHEMVASKAWSSDAGKLELLNQQVFAHPNLCQSHASLSLASYCCFIEV